MRRRTLLAWVPLAGLALPAVAFAHQRINADRIFVRKGERSLYLLRNGRAVAHFRVALGRNPVGPKLMEGDGRTPEGIYYVSGYKPDSDYYRAIFISYPNRADRERARRLGVDPGGAIAIHGLDPAIPPQLRRDHWRFNWTNGCIAVTNEEMDILWASTWLGMTVEIRP